MIKKILKAVSKHKIITAITIIVAAAGIYYFYNSLNGSTNQTSYVLAAVEKGTLITSVSGSGQVSASNQVDIKPKASGDILYIGVANGQEVKSGTLIAQLNTRDAQRAVNDAEISLESAEIKLDELLAGADAQSLLQAENAVAQAERDLEKAQENYDNIETDAEQTLKTAYEDGYSNVSASLFRLSDYIKDLQDVMGPEIRPEENILYYKRILGENSIFIQKTLDDYYNASDLYNKNSIFFREVFSDSDRDTIYRLVNDTLKTAKAISLALESVRHMYDAIVVTDYSHIDIASEIEKMQPKIESDLSSIVSTITSINQTITTIDNTVKNTPGEIKDSKLALESAQANLENKKLALEELRNGTDPLDIKIQRNTVAQKEAALLDARENLAASYIRAPFDGVATEVKVKKGDSVTSGTVIATFMTKQQIAEISLNEIDVAQVKTGQKATLTFDAIDGLSLTGEVADIDAIGTITQGVVSYNVKIVFDTQDDRVKPGMSVSANIITEAKQDVLYVPNSAIKSSNGSSYVQMIDQPVQTQSAAISQGVTSLIPPSDVAVQTGISNDTSIEITSGLKEGDQVIVRTVTPGSQTQTQTQQTNSLFGGSSNRSTGGTFRIQN